MKKIVLLTAFIAAACSAPEANQSTTAMALNVTTPMEATSFYDLTATTIDGDTYAFSELKGKRVLIVNTASKCGYTPQYEGLQELHNAYGGEDFIILGFPSNDFGFQEPGSEEKIADFCEKNYGVTFQMMSKVKTSAKGGHPVYQWLCNASQNGVSDAKVSWNFNKFLIDENGRWTAHHASRVEPMSAEITSFARGK
ncbi:MAG: glutathione peroxidase [Bacteroidetes bacterium]|nr:glutathione peroxidase [Bacteroidota bacterium]MDA0898351.1 glutathione peroxidase [Bacteroidota bacterium]